MQEQQRYWVCENTPGYLPEEDDPFEGSYEECVAYMNERAAVNWGPWWVTAESLFDEAGIKVGMSLALSAQEDSDVLATASLRRLVHELRNALDKTAAEL